MPKTISEKRKEFKELMLHSKRMPLLCGAFDGITARLVQKIGFDACYMGGQACAASVLGFPDVGLTTESEQITHAANLAACVDMPFVIDADTGYGNELNVRRTLRDLERAGIYGAHFEDQTTPKRCGGMGGVALESLEVAVSKIETCIKYREDPNFLVIGRTDAGSVYNLDEAIKRANAMADAGADMVFYGHILKNIDEIKRVCDESKVPVLYCLMEFSRDVCFTLDELKNAGVGATFWPNGLLMAWFKTAEDLMVQLKETGDPKTFYDRLKPIEECNDILGIRELNPPRMFE